MRRSGWGARWLVRVVLFGLVLVGLGLSGRPATAQGFSVSPIRIEAEVPSGKRIEVPVRLTNTTETKLFEISVQHVELVQNPDGSWRPVAPGGNLPDGHRSNLGWFEAANSALPMAPGEAADVVLRGTVPRGGRGTYVSALLVTSNEQGESGDTVRLKFQFLVPVILTISGRPSRQELTLDGLGLVLRQPNLSISPGAHPFVEAFADITNFGDSYARIGGAIRVERETDKGWRFVTSATLRDRSVVPGTKLSLKVPLDRGLPAGRYRLSGNVTVDGRLIPRRTVEIDFEGDPTLTQVAYDAQLKVGPEILNIAVSKGTLRTGTIEVTNTSDQTVKVRLSPQIPHVLATSAMEGVPGTALSAADWIEARPAEMQLRAGQSRSLRAIAQLPADASDFPYYFAEMVVEASYEDGQVAGTTMIPVVLTSHPESAAPAMMIDRIGLSNATPPAPELVHVKAINTGNTYLMPDPVATLVDAGNKVVAEIALDGPRGFMVPMSVWDYSGAVDLGPVPTGDYALRVVLRAGGDKLVVEERSVSVTETDGGHKALAFSE